MSFTLADVVPWGRTMAEYVEMFNLTSTDLQKRIVGCGDGPASFNSEMTEQGYQVTSIDPIYQFTVAQLQARIAEVYPTMMAQVEQNKARFVWKSIPSPEALGRLRMGAMERFLADYELGKAAGRYHHEALPELSFANQSFDLALCSHCLFLYSDHFSLEFHQQAIASMCRVATEVRIFPLLDLDGNLSRHVEPVMAFFKEQGYYLTTELTEYEFQQGGNQLLKLCAPR